MNRTRSARALIKRLGTIFFIMFISLGTAYLLTTTFAILFSTISAPFAAHPVWQLDPEQLAADQTQVLDAATLAQDTTRNLIMLLIVCISALALIASATKLALNRLLHTSLLHTSSRHRTRMTTAALLLPAIIVIITATILLFVVRIIRPESIPLVTSITATVGAILCFLALSIEGSELHDIVDRYLRHPFVYAGLSLATLFSTLLVISITALATSSIPGIVQALTSLILGTLILSAGMYLTMEVQ